MSLNSQISKMMLMQNIKLPTTLSATSHFEWYHVKITTTLYTSPFPPPKHQYHLISTRANTMTNSSMAFAKVSGPCTSHVLCMVVVNNDI